MTKRSLPENSPQPRHFMHVTVRRPKTWSASGSRSQLHSIAEVVRALTPVDMVHQYAQLVLYTVFHRQPVQLMKHWSDVFKATRMRLITFDIIVASELWLCNLWAPNVTVATSQCGDSNFGLCLCS